MFFVFFRLRLQSEEARANIDPPRRVCNSSRGSCAGGIVKLGNLKSISYVPLPLILSMNGGEAGGGVRAAEGGGIMGGRQAAATQRQRASEGPGPACLSRGPPLEVEAGSGGQKAGVVPPAGVASIMKGPGGGAVANRLGD